MVRAVNEFAPVPGHGMDCAREPRRGGDDDFRTPEGTPDHGISRGRTVGAATGKDHREEAGGDCAKGRAAASHFWREKSGGKARNKSNFHRFYNIGMADALGVFHD